MEWGTASVASAQHTLTTEVTTSAGVTESSSSTFTVDNSPPPTGVAITPPAAGATVSGNVLVKATAADDRAVAKVVLTVDGSVVASKTSAPWDLTWNTLDPLNPAFNARTTSRSRRSTAADARLSRWCAPSR